MSTPCGIFIHTAKILEDRVRPRNQKSFIKNRPCKNVLCIIRPYMQKKENSGEICVGKNHARFIGRAKSLCIRPFRRARPLHDRPTQISPEFPFFCIYTEDIFTRSIFDE